MGGARADGLGSAPARGWVVRLRGSGIAGQARTAIEEAASGARLRLASIVTVEGEGVRNIDSDAVITNKEIAAHLNLPPVKLHCSMLAEDAINAAIADYKAKQEVKKEAEAS